MLRRLSWSLRKLKVGFNAFPVLDVGSGANPYPNSDVLIDQYSTAEDRNFDPFIIDRPSVLGDGTKLPFKDNAFQFVILSHVLEHVEDPGMLLNEIMRVGRAGYIEVPNSLFEVIFPYETHLHLINCDGDQLIITRKSEKFDSPVRKMDLLRSETRLGKFLRNNPSELHVRLYWESNITFKIQASPDPYIPQDKFCNDSSAQLKIKENYSHFRIKRAVFKLITRAIQCFRRIRFGALNLDALICCPECKKELLFNKSMYHCEKCSSNFEKKNGTIKFVDK